MFKPLTREQYDAAIKAGFSSDQVIVNEKLRKAQDANQPPGYFSRLGADYIGAAQSIISDIQRPSRLAEEGASPLRVGVAVAEAGLRTVGKVAETAFAPIVEAPGIKQGLELAGRSIARIPGFDFVLNKISDFSLKHPDLAKDFKNVVDIAVLFGGGKAAKQAGTAVKKAGVELEVGGLKAAEAAKSVFAEELVSPIPTKAIKLQQVVRTTEAPGLFKKDIVAPTISEKASAEEVAKIPGIRESNTFQKNFNLIRDYNVGQAKQLESDVAKYNFVIPRKVTLAKLKEAAKSLEGNPLIVGDAEKTAQKLIAGAEKIVNENKGTGSGILKARKEYDQWVLSQKPKAFDATADNAFTVANRAVRDTLNTILDENAVNLGVKDSLRRQSALFNAMDNVAEKAALEANTPLLRAFDRVGKLLGVKSRLVQAVATAVGIGGLGAAATFAPAVAVLGGTGFIIYQGGRLIMRPEVRIALGKLLQEAGNLLGAEEKKIIQEALKTYE